MLSKEGFKYHLDMIDHNTIMAESYKNNHPDIAKRCLENVDKSKKILLNHFEKQQKQHKKTAENLTKCRQKINEIKKIIQ